MEKILGTNLSRNSRLISSFGNDSCQLSASSTFSLLAAPFFVPAGILLNYPAGDPAKRFCRFLAPSIRASMLAHWGRCIWGLHSSATADNRYIEQRLSLRGTPAFWLRSHKTGGKPICRRVRSFHTSKPALYCRLCTTAMHVCGADIYPIVPLK